MPILSLFMADNENDTGSLQSILDAAIAAVPAETAAIPDAVVIAQPVIETPAAVEPEPEVTPETPVVEPEPEAVVAPEPEPDDEPDAGPKRVRLSHDEDKLAAMYARQHGISITQAAIALAKAGAATNDEGATVDALSPVEAKAAELETVQAAIDAMVEEAGDMGVTTNKELRDLQKKEGLLTRELAKLEALSAVEQADSDFTADQTIAQQDEADKAAAHSAYPDLNKADSPLSQAVKAEVTRLLKVNPNLLDDPEIRFMTAAKCAAKLGVLPVTVKQSPLGGKPAVQAPAGVKPSVFTPASGAASSSAHRVEVSQADPVQALTSTLSSMKGSNLNDLSGAFSSFLNPGASAGVGQTTLLSR